MSSPADLRPGDLMFGPIGGLIPGVFPVGAGQLLLGEAFRSGRLSVRHVGIVVQASVHHDGPTLYDGELDKYLSIDEAPGPLNSYEEAERAGYVVYRTGVTTAPKLVQAMPSGAEEIPMRYLTHWTPHHAYVRLTEDYPGQAEDAAAIARLFVSEKVPYSFASYAALIAWKWGLKAERLEEWIGRRRPDFPFHSVAAPVQDRRIALPCEAICSVLADQAWSLAGKRVMQNVAHQAVTPGAMATQLSRRTDVEWIWPS